MKRTIILIMLSVITLMTKAQRGLAIDALFEGKVVPQEQMVETRVRGKEIAKYQLTFFRSLRFIASPEQQQQVNDLLEKDSKGHFAMATTQYNSQTFLIQLTPQGGHNRFLCKKTRSKNNKKKESKAEVIVIYMEGQLDSLEQLYEILNNEKQ